jgi:glycosyltransferase involved in cell wall biosynthesis
VAKNIYVATRCGWFSCRSVCYLAAGRPVVVQDTGFTDLVPAGRGLFAFAGVEDAARAIAAVEKDYPVHAAAAREIACEYFDSDKVLKDLLRAIGLG